MNVTVSRKEQNTQSRYIGANEFLKEGVFDAAAML
jgi:hypothetical protein